KQAVFGIYERTDGIVYVQPVPSVSKRTLQSIIHQKVTIETTIYSDAWPAYEGLAANYAGHETVSHGTSEWVRGTATINGIEGFWAYAKERLLKHHGVSPNHFPALPQGDGVPLQPPTPRFHRFREPPRAGPSLTNRSVKRQMPSAETGARRGACGSSPAAPT